MNLLWLAQWCHPGRRQGSEKKITGRQGFTELREFGQDAAPSQTFFEKQLYVLGQKMKLYRVSCASKKAYLPWSCNLRDIHGKYLDRRENAQTYCCEGSQHQLDVPG